MWGAEIPPVSLRFVGFDVKQFSFGWAPVFPRATAGDQYLSGLATQATVLQVLLQPQ
jgi:hypothetical protein